MRSFPFLKSFCTVLILMALFSCKDTGKEERALKEISQTLDQSAIELNRNAKESLRQLDSKLIDHLTKEKAEKWFPKADFINRLSEQANKQIDSLQQLLSKNNFVDLSKHASNVYHSYTSNVLKTDAEIDLIFKQETDSVNFRNYNSYSLANLLFSKLKHDINNLNARTVSFCDMKSTVLICGFFEKYNTIIGQSSNILMPGEFLEISAGVGAFSTAAQAKIKINDRNIPTQDAVAITKIKAPQMPGTYTVPVEITYTKPDGAQMTQTRMVTYKVVKLVE